MVIVDNKIESYASNLENGIPITDYLGQDEDDMLEILERYLIKLQDAEDVRQLILKDFCLENISELRREQRVQDALNNPDFAANPNVAVRDHAQRDRDGRRRADQGKQESQGRDEVDQDLSSESEEEDEDVASLFLRQRQK